MPPHRKTRRNYDTRGDAHFLTFSCYQRLPLLSRDRTRRWFIDGLDAARNRGLFDLWAYVVMSEHVHLVLLPHEGARIAQILSAIKQPTAKRAIPWLKVNSPDYLSKLADPQSDGTVKHRFWQRGGGYDRNVRTVQDAHEKIAYVHENPVRRGLAALPEEWPWSSARAWRTGSEEPLRIDRGGVPTLHV